MSTEPATIERVTGLAGWTFYRTPVTYLGEDAEGMAAFTTDPRRALAAMNALCRRDIGDRFTEMYDPTSLTGYWVLVHEHCGCNHLEPNACRGDLNGPVTCCQVDPDDAEAREIEDHECPHYGLPPCIEDLYTFVTEKVSEGSAGALHMFQVDQ